MAPLFDTEPEKVSVIREVTPEITTISVPFWRLGLVKFGGRATLVKLRSGGILAFSPVPLSDSIRKLVDDMGGNVEYLVAPDMEHHINLGTWKAAFPSAKVIAPAPLREKRAKASREDVPFDFAYTPTNKASLASTYPDDFLAEFDVEFFDGHTNQEIVLLHKPTSTMIEADLIFNTPSYEQFSKTGVDANTGFFTKLFQAMFTTLHGTSQQRFIWYFISKDKPSFNKSIKRVNDTWQFNRIIPCHGEVIETGGKDVFKKLFAWHIEAAERTK